MVQIEIPPLRERRTDIEPLATHLLARVGARQGRALRFSPDALRALLGYGWPGNVRELENALEYAVAVCQGQTLMPDDLPAEILPGAGQAGAGTAVSSEVEDPAAIEHRRHPAPRPDVALRRALEQHHWNRESAARALGISRTTLWRRMREAGVRE